MGGRLAVLGLALATLGVLVWNLSSGRGAGRVEAPPLLPGEPEADPLLEPRHPVEAAAERHRSAVIEASRSAVPGVPAVAFLGTVQDEAGRPVGGARVTLFDGALFGPERARSPEPLAEQVTGPDGRFRFSLPSAEGLRGVRARAAGFAARGRNQSPGVDVPFELTAAARLIGHLVGEGAAEARVLYSDPESASRGSARVDDGQGTFTVDDVPTETSLEFLVVPADALPFSVAFTLPEPGVHEREVDLGTRRSITGRVVDLSTGEPVAGAALRDPRVDATLATTGEDGRFVLPVRSPSVETARGVDEVPVTLEIAAPGFLTSLVLSALPSRDATLRLARGGRVRGAVRTADEGPAVGVEVAWTTPVQVMGPQEFLSMPAPARTVTDEHGRFALEGVPWGVDDGALEVRGPDWHFQAVDVAPADPWTPRELDLRVPRGRSVNVCVRWRGLSPDVDLLRGRLHGVEPAGWPAPRVVVVASDGDGTERTRAATDARGLARLEGLPEGELFVAPLDRPGDATPVQGDESVVELAVQPPMQTLQVRVRDWDGAALPADAHVYVAAGRGGPGLRTYGATRRADGAFELSWCTFESAARLCVRVGGDELERPAVPGELDWDLPRRVTVRIEGVVTTDGRARIAWQGPGPELAGRRFTLAPVADVLEATLPCGPLELEVGTQRASVVVAPGPDGAPQVLRLPR